MRIAVLAYNLIVSGGLSVGKNVTALLPQVGPRHTMLMLVPKGRGYDTHEDRKNVTVLEIPQLGLRKRITRRRIE